VDEIVRKVKPEGTRDTGALEGMGAEFELHVRARSVEGSMEKTAEAWGELGSYESSHWLLRCDEGAPVGGADSAPAPLVYFGAAIAF
jgi:hypothetical protein